MPAGSEPAVPAARWCRLAVALSGPPTARLKLFSPPARRALRSRPILADGVFVIKRTALPAMDPRATLAGCAFIHLSHPCANEARCGPAPVTPPCQEMHGTCHAVRRCLYFLFPPRSAGASRLGKPPLTPSNLITSTSGFVGHHAPYGWTVSVVRLITAHALKKTHCSNRNRCSLQPLGLRLIGRRVRPCLCLASSRSAADGAGRLTISWRCPSAGWRRPRSRWRWLGARW